MHLLRGYQLACLKAIQQAHSRGVTRQLVSLPTGTGKTVCFAHLPGFLGLPGKMLVLAHREELLEQAAGKLEAVNPDRRVEIEQADRHASEEADIVVASVATLGRSNGSSRLGRFDPQAFRLIVIDEAHHAVAPTYRAILEYFDVFAPPSPRSPLLVGYTATPRRGDEVGLESIFQEIVYHRDLREMIEAGYLVALRAYKVTSEVDLSPVHTRHGDFVVNELSDRVNTIDRNDLIVKAYLEKAYGSKTIVFTVDVRHAYDLALVFQRYGVPCLPVCGEMPKEERRDVLEAFRSGRIQVITNCNLLTEGFDDPEVETIIMARPTKSSLLYTQMIGRGTRTAPGKERLTVIDVVDNASRHDLVSLPSLFGLPPHFDTNGEDLLAVLQELESVQANRGAFDLSRVASIEEVRRLLTEVDLLRRGGAAVEVERYSHLEWIKLSEVRYHLTLPHRESITIAQDLLGQYEVSSILQDRTGTYGRYMVGRLSTLAQAFEVADRFLVEYRPNALPLLRRDSRWRKDPPSEKQLALLRKLNIPISPNLSKGEASNLIARYFATRQLCQVR